MKRWVCRLMLTCLVCAEFEEKEWNETREETLAQLRDFEAFMEKSISGDMTLVDEFGSAQLVMNVYARLSPTSHPGAVNRPFKRPSARRSRPLRSFACLPTRTKTSCGSGLACYR